MHIDIETGAVVLRVVSPKYGTFDVLIDAEDAEKVSRHTWCVRKDKHNRFYFQTNVTHPDGSKGTVKLHRLVTDAPLDKTVDHIHHMYTDCRKSQLSVDTDKPNAENSRKRQRYGGHTTSSRFKGVGWFKRDGKYKAEIGHNYKSIHLGLFPGTPQGEIEAARAYDHKALELFTRPLLNFPIEDYRPKPVTRWRISSSKRLAA